MPLFVWAALAITALLVSGSAASNIGGSHAVVMPAAAPLAASQSLFPWHVWLLLGALAAAIGRTREKAQSEGHDEAFQAGVLLSLARGLSGQAPKGSILDFAGRSISSAKAVDWAAVLKLAESAPGFWPLGGEARCMESGFDWRKLKLPRSLEPEAKDAQSPMPLAQSARAAIRKALEAVSLRRRRSDFRTAVVAIRDAVRLAEG